VLRSDRPSHGASARLPACMQTQTHTGRKADSQTRNRCLLSYVTHLDSNPHQDENNKSRVRVVFIQNPF